jgi:DNA-binding response OmpR family regulator
VNGTRVLVIDDDAEERTLLRSLYGRSEAEVIEAPNGIEGLKALYRARPDLVVLDDEMPDLDGWQMVERIRQLTDVPLLMISMSDREREKVRALRAGADDYVTKPFGREELLARSEALLRRRRNDHGTVRRYSDGHVEVDFAAAEARAGGERLHLSPLEFRLLAAFVRNPGQVLSQEALLDMAWGDRTLAPERVKIYVGYLRAKLRAAGASDAAIETVRGFGYRYRPPE